MTTQLRRYRTKPGQGRQFATEWREHVAPLRQQFGFRVNGWLLDSGDEFVWVIEHDGNRESFEAAETAYYASAERKAMTPDPARLVAEPHEEWMTTIG